MHHPVKLVGCELIVADLDDALTLLVDVLGLELVERRVSDDPQGELAVLAIGDAAITLLAPAAEGPGKILGEREPRLAQVILGVPEGSNVGFVEQIAESGFSVQVVDERRCFVPPGSARGALGVNTAIMLTALPDDAS